MFLLGLVLKYLQNMLGNLATSMLDVVRLDESKLQ